MSSTQALYPSLRPSGKARSFRCVSSSKHKRFAGLCLESWETGCPAPSKPNNVVDFLLRKRLHCFLLRSSPRLISTGQLHVLPHFHLRPINDVVYIEPYLMKSERSHLRGSFTLRCLQRLSRPYIATQLCPWQDNWCTRGTSIPVLSY